MALELRHVSKRAGPHIHIHDTSLVIEAGSFTSLLGTTLSGKTTLMQLIAGIVPPTHGEIWLDGRNITRDPVQRRNVSMVYQQFINYPNFNVYNNIASPLRVARMDKAEIDRRVMKTAELLRLVPLLKRNPAELSGGQQQRTALARALVKDSHIILLDEPLANLDYKLREELRDELPKLFADRQAIVLYATTEPTEALLFGGKTATLDQGRVTDYGPTSSLYRDPRHLITAQAFSDPPMNVARVEKRGNHLEIFGDQRWPLGARAQHLPDGPLLVGLRPHHVLPNKPSGTCGTLQGTVLVTEISGSESTIHAKVHDAVWISQAPGVHRVQPGTPVTLYADLDQGLFFSPNGERVS